MPGLGGDLHLPVTGIGLLGAARGLVEICTTMLLHTGSQRSPKITEATCTDSCCGFVMPDDIRPLGSNSPEMLFMTTVFR
jgi:hypothetical protein